MSSWRASGFCRRVGPSEKATESAAGSFLGMSSQCSLGRRHVPLLLYKGNLGLRWLWTPHCLRLDAQVGHGLRCSCLPKIPHSETLTALLLLLFGGHVCHIAGCSGSVSFRKSSSSKKAANSCACEQAHSPYHAHTHTYYALMHTCAGKSTCHVHTCALCVSAGAWCCTGAGIPLLGKKAVLYICCP